MIEKLTKEQEDYLPIFRDEWLTIGRSTEPMDKAKASVRVKSFYKWCGKKEPEIIFCGSSFSAWIIYNLHKFKNINLGDNLRANLWDNLGANLGANLRDNLWDNLRANLRANLRDNLRANLWDNLWDNLRANLRANLWDNLGANLRDNLRANLWDNLGANLGANLRDNLWDNKKTDFFPTDFWGQWDSYWIAWLLFGEYIGVKYPKDKSDQLHNMAELSKSCGWWYTFENAVIVCDRPKKLSINDRGQLNCEDGLAIEFRDGYGFYAIDGIRLSEQIILKPETLTIKQIQEESNMDIQQIMIQRYGTSKYLFEIGAKLVDMDSLTLVGSAPRALFEDKSGNKFLMATDGSTKRVYSMNSIRESKTCRDAHEAIAGFKEDRLIAEA